MNSLSLQKLFLNFCIFNCFLNSEKTENFRQSAHCTEGGGGVKFPPLEFISHAMTCNKGEGEIPKRGGDIYIYS